MQNDVTNYYDNIAESYDTSRFDNSYGRFIHAQEGVFLRKKLKKYAPKKVFSIGCGTGRFMEFAEIGIDISEKMLQEAKQKYPTKAFLQADATATNLPENSFDFAFSLHVLMHLKLETIANILTETARISNPDAIFVVDFPSKNRRDFFSKKQNTWHGATAFTPKDFEKIAQKNWQLIDCQGVLFLPIHRFPVFLRKYLLKLDTLLCRSFLKKYASYMLIVLKKK